MSSNLKSKEGVVKAFERLVVIIDELRERCPWDQKQTLDSLRLLTIEETYELTTAILQKDTLAIRSELGDLIMHVVFYARIASESNMFDLEQVLNAICDKLITRHPHVYGNKPVKDENDVKLNWEAIKLKEGKKSVLEGVPNALPSIPKALRIQEKVSAVGFDWNTPEEIWEKVQEEIVELQEQVKRKSQDRKEEEFGDLVFALINYARLIDVQPERALQLANNKFVRRFQKLEDLVKSDDKELVDLSLEELEVYWQKSKYQISLLAKKDS